jgi:hypothetical protein
MPHRAIPVTLLCLLAPAAAVADSPVQVAQLTIRQRIVIRVPAMPAQPVAAIAPRTPAKPIRWRERRGPSCVPVSQMAGAIVTSPRAVDMVLLGGRRVRAKLDGDCKPLDFYAGFYVRPGQDGQLCADRDAIRVRSGASCEIDQFRALEPER